MMSRRGVVVFATVCVGTLIVISLATRFRGNIEAQVRTSEALPSATRPAGKAPNTAPTGESSPVEASMGESSDESTVVGGGGDPIGTPGFDGAAISTVIRDRYSQYLTFLNATHLSTGSIWREETWKIDKLLRESITSAFQELKSFEKVSSALRETVEWQEIPEWLVATGLAWEDVLPDGMVTNLNTTEIPSGSLPIVLYKHVSISSAGELTVLQQVFLTKGNYVLQVRSGAYAVLSNEGETIIRGVGDSMPHPDSPLSIVDFLDVGDTVPWIALVMGPRGNGLYVDIGFYSFDVASGAWKPEQIHRAGEWSDVSRWSYNGNTHEFSVTYHFGSEQRVDILDFLDVARESISRRSVR
jgi:hypothetical protein